MPRRRQFYEPFTQDPSGVIRNPQGEVVGKIEEAISGEVLDEQGDKVGDFTAFPQPTAAVDEPLPGPRAFVIEQTGMYLLVDDVVAILRTLADTYDSAANPSAALALREVADAWAQ